MENKYKWPNTPLFIHHLNNNRQYIEKKLLKSPIYVMEKYDGTNVGIDNYGNMYGRNFMIEKNAKTYQETDLDVVQTYQVCAENIKQYIISILKFSEFKCIIYGELMCNPKLYRYSELPTYCPFGVVLAGLNKTQINLLKVDFDIKMGDDIITLCMNDKLYKMMIENKCNIVGYLGRYENFSKFLKEKFEWLFKGMGEGVIINMDSTTYKLKIGKEENFTNLNILNNIIDLNITENVEEIILSLVHIQNSNYENGEICIEGIKKNKRIVRQEKNTQINNEKKLYKEIIKSAMTKFDHEDTFYALGSAGFINYVDIIYEECKKDTEKMPKNIVKSILGFRFSMFKKR
uniref:RNA ligase domain-containing protein n=1 Tax=viral metagenome TaxID=1070528 RepID=A0A6C0JAZ8_9ZZZZ